MGAGYTPWVVHPNMFALEVIGNQLSVLYTVIRQREVGHILLCLEGELHTELPDGRKFVLTPGMSYQVADNAEPHRSQTSTGAKLFVVD